ncbi:hypothetical protein EYF80_058083 [Liparis tanakae]|uniref:Uncharacterized protein n=1 Tax=Liparis tanakae TaxID=230148 RepID=A0A4Z2ESH9_9TELE|nr:hypothetical protein EYF80_058083 [Liparis tanakae]
MTGARQPDSETFVTVVTVTPHRDLSGNLAYSVQPITSFTIKLAPRRKEKESLTKNGQWETEGGSQRRRGRESNVLCSRKW